MCITITQMIGFSVPCKKVETVKHCGEAEQREILLGSLKKILTDGSAYIFYTSQQEYICQCDSVDGVVNVNDFRPLIMDEDDMKLQNIEMKKDEMMKKLEKMGLFIYASWGHFTDVEDTDYY